MLLKTLCIALLLAAFPQFSPADEPTCFLQDGDRVAFFGDSITAHKVYGDLVERIFRQAHPEAEVEFINNGNSGLQLAATKLDRVLKGDPNVITIMIGMNDAINSEWVAGDPLAPKVASYKSSLTALVRSLKEQGKVVVLLSPTLTEETVSLSTFRLEGTRELLSLMGQAVEEVAQEESVYFVPVQAEFEAYANTLPRYAVLRPDGVHPNARGQYQIARSLWTHLQLTAPMGKQRGMADNLPTPWIALAPTSSLSFSDSEALTLELTTPEPGMADLTWSCGEESGSTSIELTGSNIWTLPLSESEIPAVPGSSTTVIIELKRGSSRAVFLVDFFRKSIVHAENGVATIDVSSNEGDTIATTRISREGKGLRFETSVFKDELIQGERGQSPWGKGDAVTLFLDLREPSLLGGLGYDGDVYQVWFRPQLVPAFTPGFLPTAGQHMMNLATTYGEKTPDGYTVGLIVSGYRNNKEAVDFSQHPLIGVDLSIIYATALGKQSWRGIQSTDRHNFMFPSTFPLVDLDDTIDADRALSITVFPEESGFRSTMPES